MADNKAAYKQDSPSDKFFRTRESGTVGGDAVEDQYVVDSDRAALIAAIQAVDDGLATQTTLAAAKTVLDAILTSVDGLEGFTDGVEGSLSTLNGKDFATQTTLAAVLAKLIAAPATEAKQDTLIGHVDGAEGSLSSLDGKVPDESGTWGYSAGTSGTVTLSGSKRVIGIAAHATTAGTLTINGGNSVPIPAGAAIEITPRANLVDPTIVFTGSDSFFCEYLS